MKKSAIFFLLLLAAISVTFTGFRAPGPKWEVSYSFDKCNAFEIRIFAKNNELMRTVQLKTWYQADDENFVVKQISDKKGGCQEAILDKKNQVAIQILGSGGGATPYYNAGGFKYPEEKDLKKLELVPASETKEIAGITCKRYTYTYKKIFGEVWLTDKITLPNDLGVFRAAKMAALHNTLSVPGFVMEMTTEDSGGGKTVMTTLSLQNAEKYTIDLKGVEMNVAINKVNYYTF
jgi:hypothetical protein